MNKQRKQEIRENLLNWASFHPIVATLTMEEVEFALAFEESHKNRISFIRRLNKRKTRLLVERVREENSND